MRTVRTLKAQPIAEDKPIKSTTIEIDMPVPDYETVQDQDIAFWIVAADLEDVLYKSLPGGVYDYLACKMMARNASHFTVSHGSLE